MDNVVALRRPSTKSSSSKKKKKTTHRTIFSYSAYQFVDKDPVIDKLRTAWKDSGMTYKEVKEAGGPTPGTLNNWFKGATRRPTFAAANAAARAMGKEFVLQDYRKGRR